MAEARVPSVPGSPPALASVGLSHGRQVGEILLCVAAASAPPFPVDAVLREEDRYGVLRGDPGAAGPNPDPRQLEMELARDEPLPLGTLRCEPGSPARLAAVVYDMESAARCTIPALALVLQRLPALMAEHSLRSLSLPLLGTTLGSLRPAWVLDLILTAVEVMRPPYPERLWLVVPEDQVEGIRSLLEDLLR